MIKLIEPVGYIPKEDCNGCGSGWNAKLVPDSIYFLDIKVCCCVHDFMYETGKTEAQKILADEVFRFNIYRLIDEDKNWFRNNKFMKNRMKRIADTYVLFVEEFGHDAYWEGKQ